MNLKKMQLNGVELIDQNIEYSAEEITAIDLNKLNNVSCDNHINEICFSDNAVDFGLDPNRINKIIAELNASKTEKPFSGISEDNLPMSVKHDVIKIDFNASVNLLQDTETPVSININDATTTFDEKSRNSNLLSKAAISDETEIAMDDYIIASNNASIKLSASSGLLSGTATYRIDNTSDRAIDAEKTGIDDTNLCWAATAANMLYWAGWGKNTGSLTISCEDDLLD
ncbi:MAG: hypothetical protein ACYC4Q_02905, partial [Victivallaceae bacterium]